MVVGHSNRLMIKNCHTKRAVAVAVSDQYTASSSRETCDKFSTRIYPPSSLRAFNRSKQESSRSLQLRRARALAKSSLKPRKCLQPTAVELFLRSIGPPLIQLLSHDGPPVGIMSITELFLLQWDTFCQGFLKGNALYTPF
jgi:hypothetical protein